MHILISNFKKFIFLLLYFFANLCFANNNYIEVTNDDLVKMDHNRLIASSKIILKPIILNEFSSSDQNGINIELNNINNISIYDDYILDKLIVKHDDCKIDYIFSEDGGDKLIINRDLNSRIFSFNNNYRNINFKDELFLLINQTNIDNYFIKRNNNYIKYVNANLSHASLIKVLTRSKLDLHVKFHILKDSNSFFQEKEIIEYVLNESNDFTIDIRYHLKNTAPSHFGNNHYEDLHLYNWNISFVEFLNIDDSVLSDLIGLTVLSTDTVKNINTSFFSKSEDIISISDLLQRRYLKYDSISINHFNCKIYSIFKYPLTKKSNNDYISNSFSLIDSSINNTELPFNFNEYKNLINNNNNIYIELGDLKVLDLLILDSKLSSFFITKYHLIFSDNTPNLKKSIDFFKHKNLIINVLISFIFAASLFLLNKDIRIKFNIFKNYDNSYSFLILLFSFFYIIFKFDIPSLIQFIFISIVLFFQVFVKKFNILFILFPFIIVYKLYFNLTPIFLIFLSMYEFFIFFNKVILFLSFKFNVSRIIFLKILLVISLLLSIVFYDVSYYFSFFILFFMFMLIY